MLISGKGMLSPMMPVVIVSRVSLSLSLHLSLSLSFSLSTPPAFRIAVWKGQIGRIQINRKDWPRNIRQHWLSTPALMESKILYVDILIAYITKSAPSLTDTLMGTNLSIWKFSLAIHTHPWFSRTLRLMCFQLHWTQLYLTMHTSLSSMKLFLNDRWSTQCEANSLVSTNTAHCWHFLIFLRQQASCRSILSAGKYCQQFVHCWVVLTPSMNIQ